MRKVKSASKILMIYSGKGGVGKTTTTINTAKNLANQGKRVYIVDGDINSPSIHVVLGSNQDVSENLRFNSIGIACSGMVYIQASMIKSYLSDTIKDIKKFKPDVVLIDTPPSITDVHINLIEKMKVSGVLMVTQANQLSMEDVRRTSGFFKLKEIPVVGIIDNMVGDIFGSENTDGLGFKKIASIPLDAELASARISTKSLELYNPVSELINTLDDVILENRKRELVHDDSLDEQCINDALNAAQAEYNLSRKRNKVNPFSVLRFYNLSTWDFVTEQLAVYQKNGMFGSSADAMLSANTTERIKAVLDAFESEDEAFFMINKSTSFGGSVAGNDINLIVGEIGQASLITPSDKSDLYYCIPRINYQAGKDNVILFPHEVIPMTYQTIQGLIENGGYKILNDRRYMPSKDQIEDLYHSFGERVGLCENWESYYDAAVAE